MRLVDHEQGSVLPRELAKRLVVTGIGKHDAGVGHRGLRQYAGNVAGLEGALEGGNVVPLDCPRRQRQVDGRTDVVGP